MQKHAYAFMENDATVPIENSMHIIYPDPQKEVLNMTKKKKQMQQISTYECELSMRLLLYHDTIFHGIPIPSYIETQRTPPNYVENQLV